MEDLKVKDRTEQLIELMEEWMNKNGRKRYELAGRLGVPEATVSRWLSGKSKISKAWQELIQLKLN